MLLVQVPYYDYALDLILDSESPSNEILTEEQHELVRHHHLQHVAVLTLPGGPLPGKPKQGASHAITPPIKPCCASAR